MQPEIGWLPDPSPSTVTKAVVAAGIDPAELVITSAGGNAPAWFRATAAATDFVVKFAWSEEAATKLWHEGQVLDFLSHRPLRLVPKVRALTRNPVLVLTERVGGGPLWYPDVCEMSNSQVSELASQIAGFLASLHDRGLLADLRRTVDRLPPPQPQATTDAIRRGLPRYLRDDQAALVVHWCDWADAVLEEPIEEVSLHGDFAGHNWLWDSPAARLVAVVDFEEAAVGDPHYDLRYLPAQDDALRVLTAVCSAYSSDTGRDLSLHRIFAWHLRTSFGDALWRSEAGIPLPYDGKPSEWVDEFATRLSAAGIAI